MSEDPPAAQRAPARFKPYPAYKDSGIEWLGAVPELWTVTRLKHLAGLNPESLPEDTDPTLEMVYVDIGGVDSLGHIVEREAVTFGAAPSRARRVVRDGDVIVSTVRTYLRAIVPIRNPEPGTIVSTGFAVIRPREALTTGYAAYALRSPYFVERVVANSKGVSFPAINESEMGTYELAVPPEPEQRAIAAFLDRETARIDSMVAKKEQLIALLEEKRTALITQAVTKGLDPKCPSKDSGIEWLGSIPAHWEVRRLKDVVRTIEQGWSPLCENRLAEIDEWGVLKVGCVNGAEFDESENKALPRDLEPLHEYEIMAGDILMSRANTRELLGSAALVTHVRPRLLLCDKLYRIQHRPELLKPEFLIYALMSRPYRFHFEREATGASASMQNISQETVADLKFALPPLAEQERITSSLNPETVTSSRLTQRVREAIARLRELRTALISAAVTGKIDIRNTSPA